jgi:hypothetical protein
VGISRGLCRLYELRQIEELQQASVFETALAELHQLNRALELARTREGNGRALVSRSVRSGETQDRIIGLEEIEIAVRISTVLMARVRSATEKIQRIRNEFLHKRLEKRQAETLLQSALEREASAAQRKMQLALDEWTRLRRREEKSDAAESARSTESSFSAVPRDKKK